MKKSRTRNSIYNSLYGMAAYIFVMISTMATRIVFARYMGSELLGLNSLYTSILHVLQISELGIGSAMIITLYAPLKEGNKECTKAIMQIYRKIYNLFSIVLLILGLIIQEFLLKYIVNVSLDFNKVKLYYFLFLLGIVSSYLFAYNKSILYAEQKNRVISFVNAVTRVLLAVLQIISVTYFKNYVVFLILNIIAYLMENIICYIYVNKEHAYLKEKDIIPLQYDDKKEIVELIKPIFVTRLADKILSQCDSLLINYFVNIITLGLYTNYLTIFNACLGLFNPVGAALTSSYGHLAVSANSKTKYATYKKSYFILHFIVLFFSIYFISIIQDFIIIAYGEEFSLSYIFIMLLTIYLYLSLTKTIYYSIQNALGLQRIDQNYTIMQVIFNLLISVLLGYLFGLNGIILGTILSLLIFPMNFKGRLLYEKVFKLDRKFYYKKTIINYFKFLCLMLISLSISKIYTAKTILLFIIKAIIMCLICFILIIIFYIRDTQFIIMIQLILKSIPKKK